MNPKMQTDSLPENQFQLVSAITKNAMSGKANLGLRRQSTRGDRALGRSRNAVSADTYRGCESSVALRLPPHSTIPPCHTLIKARSECSPHLL